MAAKVLVAGGGVAALEALIGLRDLAREEVAPVLLAPNEELVYRPLSTADPFALGPMRSYPISEVVRTLVVEWHRAGLAAVDPAARTVSATDGQTLSYDHLVVAIGARAVPAFQEALTFGGPEQSEAMHGVVRDVEGGYVRSVAFIVPGHVAWALPAYELALQLAGRAFESSLEVAITLVTSERGPLDIFGEQGSAEIARLLDEAGVRLVTGVAAEVHAAGQVRLGAGGETLHADRIVALPRLEGPAIPGLPANEHGFIPIDAYCAVRGVERVHAAGDATDFPVKQGGLATQMADVVVRSVAAAAGAPVTAEPFKPVLRGMLLTGTRPRWIRYERDRPADRPEFEIAERALWWPPSKIAGRYLAPFLGHRDEQLPPEAGLPLEVALEADPAHPEHRHAVVPRPRVAGEPQAEEGEE